MMPIATRFRRGLKFSQQKKVNVDGQHAYRPRESGAIFFKKQIHRDADGQTIVDHLQVAVF